MNVNGITALPGAFAGAINLIQLPENISGIVDTSYMLSGATSYNARELETWDFTDTVNMSGMLDDCGFDPDTYNSFIMTLAEWVTETGASGRVLGAANVWWGDVEVSGYTYSGIADARDYLSSGGWTISGDTEAMVLVYDTSFGDGTNIELPLRGSIDCTVYWGDGTSDSYVEANSTTDKRHSWGTGVYTIIVTGGVYQWGVRKEQIPVYVGSKNLYQWRSFGDIGLVIIYGAFQFATKIEYIPSSIPSSVTQFRLGWHFIGGIDGDILKPIESWNTSNWTVIDRPFWQCRPTTTIDISGWDLDGVTDYAFALSSSNNNINIIDTWHSNITNIGYMAAYNNTFKQDVTSLDVRKVENMSCMFNWASAFNQNLGAWQLKKSPAPNMGSMLYNCGMSVENYSRTLIGWANYVWNDGAPNGPFNVTLGSLSMAHDTTTYGSGHFTDAATARAWLTTARDPEDATVGAGWTIAGDFEYSTMTTLEFTVTEGNLGITLDPRGTSLSYRVDNGDGTAGVRLTTNGNVSRTLAEAGTYEVKVAGNYQQWGNTTATANISKLARVLKISESVTALPGAWRNATNLTAIPSNVDWVTDVSYMLSGATAYSGVELSTWDVTQWTNAEHVLDGTAIDIEGYDYILSGWADMVDTSGELIVGVDGLVYSATGSGYVDTLESYGWVFSGHMQEEI